MLDGLLGRGFAAKCKSLMKFIKSRIDVIRRKRNATQKFLKKDIADLLANGLDINAYGRAEGLIAELNVSFCYDFVEQCCNFVLKHLSVMQKLSGCPEDCREAVSSLMFAAARFSDLPELRDLRHIFQERYGNSIEYFVNQEFTEKLASKPATMEKKVQLMQDIASEFSIRFDSVAFLQRMSRPSASPQGQLKNCGSLNISNDKYKSVNAKGAVALEDKHDLPYKEKAEHISDGHGLHNGKNGNVSKRNELLQPRQVTSDGHKPFNCRDETSLKMDNRDVSSLKGRQEVIGYKPETWDGKEDAVLKIVRAGSSSHGRRIELGDDTFKPIGGRENAVPERQRKGNFPYGKAYGASSYAEQHLKSNGKELFDIDDGGQKDNSTSTKKIQEQETLKLKPHHNSALPPPYGKELFDIDNGGQKDNATLTKKIQEDETPKWKPHYNSALPPPYVKRNVKSKDGRYEANLESSTLGFNGNGISKDSSAGDISERNQVGPDHHDHDKPIVGTTRANGLDDEKDSYYKDDGAGSHTRKSKSVRRRHHRSPSGHDNVDNVGDAGVVKRKSRSKRRDESRRGLQILVDDERYQNNEEERIIDKLLMHYSKKPSSYEQVPVRRKSKNRHADHEGGNVGGGHQTPSGDVSDEMSEMVNPVRSISLPREQRSTSEARKVFARAASFQPDRSNVRHVHPKLPDYDDLAARFAALKGR